MCDENKPPGKIWIRNFVPKLLTESGFLDLHHFFSLLTLWQQSYEMRVVEGKQRREEKKKKEENNNNTLGFIAKYFLSAPHFSQDDWECNQAKQPMDGVPCTWH